MGNLDAMLHYCTISSNISCGLPSPLALSREALTPVGLLRHPSRSSRESSVPGGDNVSREEREDAKSVYLLLTGTFRELPRASARDWQSFPRPLKLR
ncbi:protein of unknown function [Methanoculleus bourgensis]|uniref:Uncharacterized protein n=1 Tax=Methanoculleus bourgensis TaxID=83986 RepID=A0A0X3BQH2_9EURY|nr:protein of unknown function [Methanoculleus bourgensis]